MKLIMNRKTLVLLVKVNNIINRSIITFMDNIMYHYTYLITNNENGMKYIGVRSSKCIPEEDDIYMGSSKVLNAVISQLGVSGFIKEILEKFESRELAVQNEIELHNKFDVDRNVEFYNKSKQTSTGFDQYGYQSQRMIDNNPMKDPAVAKKVSETMKRRYASGSLKPTQMSEQGLERCRRAKLGDNNPLRKHPELTNTAKPVEVYYLDGTMKRFEFMKQVTYDTGVPYSTLKCIKRYGTISKKWNIKEIKQIEKDKL